MPCSCDQCQFRRNKTEHRRPPKPEHYKHVPGKCNICGETVFKGGQKTGESVGRGTWHNECAQEWNELNDPKLMKVRIKKRDGDRCRTCGKDKCYLELDHILPLIDGGGFVPDNLQLLCYDCHKAKTAKESTDRAFKRKGQLRLEL